MAAPPKPKIKPSRLKVFRTQIGLHQWLVAAPSQKAALEAWDVKENLFAIGAAKTVADKASIDLAMRTPGAPVAADAGRTFVEASGVIGHGDHRKPVRLKTRSLRTPKRRAKPKPTKAALVAVDRAELALTGFRARAQSKRTRLLCEQKALDQKVETLEDALSGEEEELVNTLASAKALVDRRK